MTLGGIALWLFAAYAPVRDPIMRTLKHFLNYIAAQF